MADNCTSCGKEFAYGESQLMSNVYGANPTWRLCEPCLKNETDLIFAEGTNVLPRVIEQYEEMQDCIDEGEL